MKYNSILRENWIKVWISVYLYKIEINHRNDTMSKLIIKSQNQKAFNRHNYFYIWLSNNNGRQLCPEHMESPKNIKKNNESGYPTGNC